MKTRINQTIKGGKEMVAKNKAWMGVASFILVASLVLGNAVNVWALKPKSAAQDEELGAKMFGYGYAFIWS